MGDTSIEWTHVPGFRGRTWNPTRGCSRVSPGCEHCYAEAVAERFCGPGLPFEGFAHARANGGGWTRKVSLVGDKLTDPLSWREPSCVFTNSMSDLFHEALAVDAIAAVFGVMAATPRHRYIVLTKRAERMREIVSSLNVEMVRDALLRSGGPMIRGDWTLPLDNLDLGVSVENQRYADERIPFLIDTPAARRIVSYEPALGPVDFGYWLHRPCGWSGCGTCSHRPADLPMLDQIIIGGESGQGARLFDLGWARSVIAQCREAGTAVFFKQAGRHPTGTWNAGGDGPPIDPNAGIPVLQQLIQWPSQPSRFRGRWLLNDKKGGALDELPPDLRVRMFPGDTWPEPEVLGG